jgi:hypothetical protein
MRWSSIAPFSTKYFRLPLQMRRLWPGDRGETPKSSAMGKMATAPMR